MSSLLSPRFQEKGGYGGCPSNYYKALGANRVKSQVSELPVKSKVDQVLGSKELTGKGFGDLL